MFIVNGLPRGFKARKRLRQVFIVLLLAGLLMMGHPAQAQTPGPYRYFFPLVSKAPAYQAAPQIYATSHYMSSISASVAYNKGCELGTRDAGLPGYQLNLAILDYGKPVSEINGASQLGTRIFSAIRVPISDIENSARNFALGYYVCTGADTGSRVIVGIGTNNYQDDDTCSFCAVNYAHGRAWAEMVNRVNTWIMNNGYAGQVSAVGANDIELTWNTYARTKDWLDGYDSGNQYEMLNYGAIEGCPYFGATGARCGGGNWTTEQVWQVIWGSGPVWPVPEIYLTNGVNAQQWYLMSVYAYQTHGLAIEFRGVMTQWQACQQRGGCYMIDNTPEQGWSQLQSLVNGNPATAHPILYITDIRW